MHPDDSFRSVQVLVVRTPRLGIQSELQWAWLTMALSALVGLAYAYIAFNWYFQSKMARRRESAASLKRLRGIFVACAACGLACYVVETSWALWRLYDAVLVVVAARAWHFALRMRGMSLVGERLAQATELEKSAQKYREIAELLPQMVWTATETGEVDYSNGNWSQYAGDDRKWLDAVHAEQRQEVLGWWRQTIASRARASREVRLCGARGAARTFLVTATPIVRGDAVRWLGACADVEDQKLLAQEKDRQAKQKLFFLNSLSHDLRAPLNNVALNAQLLSTHVTDAEAVESVNSILENALAAADLVTRLLDFAKLGTHDRNQVSDVSLPELLNQIVRRFQPIAEQKGLYVRSHAAVATAADTNVDVQTDRVKLERVISNLVDNGLKYTQRGGVDLSVSRTARGVAVTVADTGVGIPAKCVPHLFDEFFQVNNHERDSRKGFGLGLAICTHLARQIGADVRLADTGSDGSRFEVALDVDLQVRGVGAAGGGRQDGPAGDRAAAQEAGLCRV
jgi:PAS domain S-box-containing protein